MVLFRIGFSLGKEMVINKGMEQCRRIQEETKCLEKVRPFFAHRKGT